MSFRRVLPFLFWGIALILIVWVLRTVPLVESWQLLQQLHGLELVAWAGLNGLVWLFLTARWQLILITQGYHLPWSKLWQYRLAAFGISFFTPGPHFGGEPFQVYALERFYQLPRSTAIAGIALDKTVELIISFSFLLAGVGSILQQQLLPQFSEQALPALTAFLLIPIGLLGSMSAGKHPLTTFWQHTPQKWQRHLPHILSILQQAEWEVGHFCRTYPRQFLWVMLISVLGFLLLFVEYGLTLRFLGLSLTFSQLLTAFTIARLSLFVPTPGAIGAVEAGQIVAFQALGLDPAIALSLTLLSRLRDISLGLWGMASAGKFFFHQPT